ncbi:MAG: flagellar protein FlaG [Thiotrichales bacterium]|nr:flagellar protein FlaG [Thiotrichales bacterium]
MNTLQNSISADTQYKSVDVSAQTAASSGATQDAAKVSAASIKKVTTSVSAQQVAINAAISSTHSKQPQATSTPASNSSSSTKEDNKLAMEILNNKLAQLNNQMQFKKDEVSGLTYFSLIDSTTHKVIKQYPSEDFLHVARRLTEYLDRVHSSQPLSSATDSRSVSSAIGNIISESA